MYIYIYTHVYITLIIYKLVFPGLQPRLARRHAPLPLLDTRHILPPSEIIYIYIYILYRYLDIIYISMYIYIYREREKERERDSGPCSAVFADLEGNIYFPELAERDVTSISQTEEFKLLPA